MNRKLSIAALSILLCASLANAREPGRSKYDPECTKMDAAEMIPDYLDSWKNAHLAYKQFWQCDDGGPAEGFSEAVARLMADHWADITQLLPQIHNDPGFEGWVIGHLDETDNYDDLRKIDDLAQNECPATAHELCNKIHAHIQSLPKE